MTKNKALTKSCLVPVQKSLCRPRELSPGQLTFSDIIGLVRASIQAPSISLINLQILQNNVVHSSDIDGSHRRLEFRVKVNSINNIDTTNTAETVVGTFGAKEVVCQLVFCAQHID